MLADEVAAVVVPSGDVVFVEATLISMLEYTHVCGHCGVRDVVFVEATLISKLQYTRVCGQCGVRIVSLFVWGAWYSSFSLFQLAFRKFDLLINGMAAPAMTL